MKKIDVVVIGIVVQNSTFLLTRRQDVKNPRSPYHNKWQFPGGGLEFGESPEEAIERELLEEIGVEVEIVCLVPKIFHTVRNNVWQGVFIAYICRMKNPHKPIRLDHEASEYAWLTIDEVKKRDTIHLTQELLEKAVSCI